VYADFPIATFAANCAVSARYDVIFICVSKHSIGLLVRKHVLQHGFRKAPRRQWRDFLSVTVGSDLLFFRPVKSALKHANAVKSTSWQSREHLVDFVSLRHAIASPLPSPGYSAERPNCFQLLLANHDLYLFQCESQSAVDEWVSVINWWAARESREPLPAAIGSGRHGFEPDLFVDLVGTDRKEEGISFLVK
jgi:hypothetical protein